MEEDENGANSSAKKVAKKKHYPFGTSHSQAFSDFVHLADTDKEFVKQLAASSNIEAEIIEVQPKRYRRPPPPPKNAIPADEEDDEIPDAEGSAPCTRPACVAVVKAIIELQSKNYVEKLEIEDEYHRLLEELNQAEQQVSFAEQKLEKLNEVGNQLELKLGQLMQKVEGLEKNKENLQNERSDINNKIMVSETESHKITRKLERAQKALADAMWRKKKQDQLENVEAGLSLASSVISEQPIKQATAKQMAAALELYKTGYNKLAKVNVVDFNERQPGVKTLTPFLEEKLIYEAETLDKYSRAFYQSAVRSQLRSRRGQDELELDKLDDRVVARFKDCGINGASFFFDPLNTGIKGGDRSRISSRPSVSDCRSQNQSMLLDRSLEGRQSRSEPVVLLPHLRLSERSSLRQPSLGSLNGHTAREISLSRLSRSRSGDRSLSPPHGSLTDPFEFTSPSGAGRTDNGLMRGSVSSWTNGTGQAPGQGQGGIGGDLSQGSASSNSNSSSHHAQALDPVFFKESARASWGRKAPLGKVRAGPLSLSGASSTSSFFASPQQQQQQRGQQQSSSQGGAASSADLRLYQQIKSFSKSKLLTTRHPGMDTFHDSITLSATSSVT